MAIAAPADPERFIKWIVLDREQRYDTLADFARDTGFEVHGIEVDFDLFEDLQAPEEGKTYSPETADPRLRAGANSIDAGIRLPNINDFYFGTAPDLGCCEKDTPLPDYGPRHRGRR